MLSLSSKKKNKVLARCLCFSVLHHYKFNHLDCEILSQYTEFNQTLISKWLTDSVSLDYCMCHYTVFLLHISCSGIIHTQSCDSLLMGPDLLINLLSLLFGIFYFKGFFFFLIFWEIVCSILGFGSRKEKKSFLVSNFLCLVLYFLEEERSPRGINLSKSGNKTKVFFMVR